MALRMGALYDALRTGQGISEEAARKAAEEVANYENRIGKVESDLVLLKWMVGINIGLSVMILGRLLTA